MKVTDAQLKTFTIDSGLVSRKDIEGAEKFAREKNTSLGEALISLGLLSEDDVRRLQAHILGIPFVSLVDAKIDIAVLTLIP